LLHEGDCFAVVVQFYRRGFIVAGSTMFFCDTNPLVHRQSFCAVNEVVASLLFVE